MSVTSTNLYFFCGEETFLMEEGIAKLLSTVSEKESFEGKGCELPKILGALMANSLFCTTKIVLIKNPVFLSKSIEAPELELLQALIQEALSGPHIVVIYMVGEKIDQRRKAVTLLKKHATFMEFHPFKDWEQDQVIQWIQQRVKLLGKTIDMDAVLSLAQMGGQNLRFLFSEIEKLRVYIGDKSAIGVEDVHASSGGVSARWFSFNEALKQGDVSTLLKTATLLMDSGEEPIKLMGGIHSTLKFYLQMIFLDSKGMDTTKMATTMGKNPYFVKQIFGAVKRKYSLEKLKRVYRFLNQRDFEIKSGLINPQIAVELVLMEVGR